MLDDAIANPLIAAAIALSGVLLGLAIGRFVLPGRRKIRRLEGEIEQLRRESADYRVRVRTHFNATGELIGQMTASYKAVYDHLSEGAQTLCTDGARPAVGFANPKLIIAENVDVTASGVRASESTSEERKSVPSSAAPVVDAAASAHTADPIASTREPAVSEDATAQYHADAAR